MNTKIQFINIYKLLIVLFIISFLMFLLLINASRIFRFKNQLISVTASMNDPDEDLLPIYNNFTLEKTKNPDPNNQFRHTAAELGYQDNFNKIDEFNSINGLNILLVGIDRTEFTDEKARADVIIIMKVLTTGKITLISIPRDTIIESYDEKFGFCEDKIGHSLYWGNMELLKKYTEQLLYIKIDKIITIDNFRSFEAILASLGGITIDKYLSGELGRQWIRNRSFKFGDIERCKRQQIFIKKTISKLWKVTNRGNLFISLFLYNNFSKMIDTDITKREFIEILFSLKTNNFNPENDIFTSVLPGAFDKYDSVYLNRKNLDCWRADTEKIYTTFAKRNSTYNDDIITNIPEEELYSKYFNVDLKTLFVNALKSIKEMDNIFTE